MAMKTIVEWSEGSTEFIYNWATAIRNGFLQKENICLLLFMDLVKYGSCKGAFCYEEKSLLWWIMGYKQFGENG